MFGIFSLDKAAATLLSLEFFRLTAVMIVLVQCCKQADADLAYWLEFGRCP